METLPLKVSLSISWPEACKNWDHAQSGNKTLVKVANMSVSRSEVLKLCSLLYHASESTLQLNLLNVFVALASVLFTWVYVFIPAKEGESNGHFNDRSRHSWVGELLVLISH